MTRDIQSQYIVELPVELQPLPQQVRNELLGMLGGALNILFDLPINAPTNVRARYTHRFQLVEANGSFARTPDPLEVTGVWVGVYAAWLCNLGRDTTYVDLKSARQVN